MNKKGENSCLHRTCTLMRVVREKTNGVWCWVLINAILKKNYPNEKASFNKYHFSKDMKEVKDWSYEYLGMLILGRG